MNSYFTDVVGDENDYKAKPPHPRRKSEQRPDWLIFISSLTPCSQCGVIAGACLDPTNCPNEMCSCGSRQKHKCVKESESGYGKMCLKEE